MEKKSKQTKKNKQKEMDSSIRGQIRMPQDLARSIKWSSALWLPRNPCMSPFTKAEQQIHKKILRKR